MLRLALATSSNYPNLTEDDRLLLEPLRDHGIHAHPAIWNNSTEDWSKFAGVLIRSCWDYHLQADKFLAWIQHFESANIPILNPAPLLRWNANKLYLRELDTKGIPIVPTFWPQNDTSPIAVKEGLRQLGWHKAVVKPRISATAYRTQLVTPENAASAQPLFDELHRGPGVMLQKFMDSITTEGEWSLIFFANKFSHAVLKKPQPGDFRVQNDFGGTSYLADPPAHVLAGATRAVHAVDPVVYARVDGVVAEDRFLLMELELIEPMLFLADHPEAPTRFAVAIANAVARTT
jgi:glutathione synthase/RimK-type ligase-like ATP-grasp enzyme